MFSKYPILSSNNITQNPFIINIEDKEEYSIEEYQKIQEELEKKNVDSIVESLYSHDNRFIDLSEFQRRISRGFKQKIIDVSNNLLPTKNLYKIGNGGNGKNCIVSCTALTQNQRGNETDNSRHLAQKKIVSSLIENGYNGYVYLITGGFPNPSGVEIKYAGVPYCFKIFTMLEAHKKGFDKIIWVDAVCIAANNPQPLFDILYEQDTLISSINEDNNYKVMAFDKTVQLLNEVTGVAMHFDTYYIETIVFGLNFASTVIKNIVKEYYEMVELGWPFFSVFPEEIVLSALFNKPEYKILLDSDKEKYKSNKSKLKISEQRMSKEDATKNGFYFYQIDYSKK
uniref:Uncharacterized protein n=1 Tax=viral metagenome TaxID=1070528 RepID=A0A6C0AZN5_9ZZZZ